MALHTYIFRSNAWISVPILLCSVALAFYILAQAADQHFLLVVGRMADMMHFSTSMGGVTLLALGNGAPDVFASIAAVRGGNARIGLGAIVSAGLFVTSFVVGFVALAAAPFSLKPISFIRDIFFYILGASLLFLIYLSGQVHVWQAVGLVSLYGIFVIVVFAMDQKGTSLKSSKWDINAEDKIMSFTSSMPNANAPCIDHVIIATNGISVDAIGEAPNHLEDRGVERKNLLNVLFGLVSSIICFKPKGFDFCKQAEKVHMLWHFPVNFLLRATIPAVDLSMWNRYYAAANIICCPMILLYIVSSAISPHMRIVFLIPDVYFPLWLIILFQSSIIAVAYLFMTKEEPKSELPIAVVTAFVMSVFWISLVAGELLGCLAALGTILKLPPALLGLTVLAWGNSIGDLVADVAVARSGQPAMAIAGCFAGPMFNMLVGFGMALAMKSIRSYPVPYGLDYNRSIGSAFGFLFTSLLSSLVMIAWFKFQVPRFWGFCLIGLYTTFVLVSVSNANLW